jgi:molybdopterin/thiamine biosynthesis adenylyltransferase
MNPDALLMYDDDVVEQANMSGQLYCKEDVGKTKVDAMANMITRYTTMSNIYAIRNKFTSASEAGNVMICGFDNMVARKTFFHAWRKHMRDKSEEEKGKCLYLDGRLSIDTLQVFCITGDNDWAISEYMEKYLFSDAEAEETQCSLKQTTYLACMIGSFIVNLFTNFVANLLSPVIPYDLPFLTEYDAQNMIFKTVK